MAARLLIDIYQQQIYQNRCSHANIYRIITPVKVFIISKNFIFLNELYIFSWNKVLMNKKGDY